MSKQLIQYQGGGYDGCIWEYNYFCMIDGVFHNIFSSGCCGIETADRADGLLKSDDTKYVYDLENEESVLEFCTESNSVNVAGVLKFFEDNPDLGVEFVITCSECSRKIMSYGDMHLVDWHGCGGIMSTADKILCMECYGSGLCECCNEYVGEEDLSEYEDEYICSGCKEYREQTEQEEKLRDLRFKSLLTGEPDMFSDELKEFWD